VTQISPIHSSFTPLIRLGVEAREVDRVRGLPRSIVFRYARPVFNLTAALFALETRRWMALFPIDHE